MYFIQCLDGPVDRLEHSRNFSVTADWGTIMTFSNVWEQDAPFPLIAWHHLTDFKFTMDGNGLANLVDAFGQPAEDGTPLIETYWPGGTFVNMPRYDAEIGRAHV